MIVATAGHVDHGKTALVKQLTGVDTDRLEEEKRRGLSISLGYAYLPMGENTPIGFIDVPGHHRFINNMIAGISGIDLGLLVVAADDGPMPQTCEHLDVLRVLGVGNVVSVISKVDRVDEARCSEVATRTRALLEERGWDAPDLFAVSNATGSGIGSLREYLLALGERQPGREAVGCFRLSVDRVFTIKGAGVVVTGTVAAGRVSVGDVLALHPGGGEVRVRGVRVHDREADDAREGQRCALNLGGGIAVTDIARGDWLLSPDAGPPSRRVAVSFTLLADAPFSLKQLAPVKLYLGAGRIAGRLALLQTSSGEKRLHPGDECLAQLVLDEAIPCYTGQRFLLRDHAENVLLGGGRVLDPNACEGKTSSPASISRLRAMAGATPELALATLAGHEGLIDLAHFRQAWNLAAQDELPLPEVHAVTFASDGREWLVNRDRWRKLGDAVLDCVNRWHDEHPQEPGIKVNALRETPGFAVETPLLTGVIGRHVADGVLALRDGRIGRVGFSPALPEGHHAAWSDVHSCLTRHGRQVPLLSELSLETGISVTEFERVARDALKDSRLFRVSQKRYALPAQLLDLSRDVVALDAAGEALSVVALKESWGVGRNLAVELLEFFDSIHFTRREGNVRVVKNAGIPGRLFDA